MRLAGFSPVVFQSGYSCTRAGARVSHARIRGESDKMSIQHPWLASYPPGVPAQIDVNEYSSLARVLESACDRFRHRPAFSNMGKVLSYGDIDRLSRQFASYLLNDLKLNKGDR